MGRYELEGKGTMAVKDVKGVNRHGVVEVEEKWQHLLISGAADKQTSKQQSGTTGPANWKAVRKYLTFQKAVRR